MNVANPKTLSCSVFILIPTSYAYMEELEPMFHNIAL